MKRYISLSCLLLFMLSYAPSGMAGVPERVKVSLTQGTVANTSNIAISWKGWAGGDRFFRSIDGISWTEFTPGPGPEGLRINGDEAAYLEANFPNWDLVYYKITDGTSSKRINVFPPIEHGHANYSDDTNQCKVCHITHTATGARLLSASSVQQLCYTCHGTGGTGSRYNVEKGLVLYAAEYDWTAKGYKTGGTPVPAYRRALGGPFAATAVDSSWNNRTTSSSHDIDRESQLQNAPGGGGNMTLSCISCHNAHASNENYRLLNFPALVEGYARINTGATLETDFREAATYYNNGMNRFCSSCHGDFNRPAGSGHSALDAVYRHATEVDLTWTSPTGQVSYTTTLPTYLDQGDGNTEKIFCLTCHYAHGTTAQGLSPSVNHPSGSTVLKRRDNMGICEDCHKK